MPAEILRELSIEVGDSLELNIQDGAIVLVPHVSDPIQELRGLGREIWGDEDAQEYVSRQREEW
jgi:hypothetical protein